MIPIIKILTVGIVAMFFIFNLFEPHFIDAFIESNFWGILCSNIYFGIEKTHGLGIFLAIVLLLISIVMCIGLARYRQPWWVKFLSILLFLWILLDNYWNYQSVVWPGDFRWMIASFLSLITIAAFIHRRKAIVNDATGSNANGFTTDNTIRHPDRNAQEFAKVLISKMIQTDVSVSAFAIGIEGTWGSGKSTFLGYIRQSLPNEVVVMDFNPWLSISDKSLVKSFFDVMANVVSKELDRDLFSPITQYGDAIASLDGVGGWMEAVKNYLLRHLERDIYSLKERISEVLRNRGKNIVVIIDDMDRLDHKELFEVLRLIRNTADFPGVFYIAAYDRDYVTEQLQNCGISRAESYLEKIFNLEMNLPKTLAKDIQYALVNELKDMLPGEKYVHLSYPVSAIKDILQNYREMKRFAREFSLSLSFMVENIGSEEFNSEDLFVLELIRYSDYGLYQILRNDLNEYLKKVKADTSLTRLYLKKEKVEKSSLQEQSRKLLSILFAEGQHADNSICFGNNYARYFTLAVDNNILLKHNFEEWLKCGEEKEMACWTECRNEKILRSSLLFRFSMYPSKNLSDVELKRFITGLLRLWKDEKEQENAINHILKKVINAKRTPQVANQEFFRWLKKVIAECQTNEALHASASYLYKQLRNPEWEIEEYVRELERDNLNRYLSTYYPTALDIYGSTTLNVIYSNSLDWSTHYYGYDSETGEPYAEKTATSAVFNELIEYFKRHPSAEKSRFMDEMFTYDDIDGDSGEVYRISLDEDEIEGIIIRTFGSRKYYDIFVKEAFQDNPHGDSKRTSSSEE